MFPGLLPLRLRQRKFCFYLRMKMDGQAYARTLHSLQLPHKLFQAGGAMYNSDTGFDMEYQRNKVHNLRLVARMLDGLLIKPGETFSFWHAARHADRENPFKDGLTVKDGQLTTAPGGGLCQMSNLLFWVFLHAPLTIVERHTHELKDFPSPSQDAPEGVDATVSEGWLDLKVRNDTHYTFQISIGFDEECIYGSLYADQPMPCRYHIVGRDLNYFQKGSTVYEKITILRQQVDKDTGCVLNETPLYHNLCRIGYQLPVGTPVWEKGNDYA